MLLECICYYLTVIHHADISRHFDTPEKSDYDIYKIAIKNENMFKW